MHIDSNVDYSLAEILDDCKVDYVLTVPCSILSTYYNNSAAKHKTITLTREEEGVGIASGFTLLQKRAVLMIQNSGFGNSINALTSLSIAYKLGFLIILTMRGDDIYENNPVQIPLGKATRTIIKAIGCEFIEINSQKNMIIAINEAFNLINKTRKPVFVLLPRKEVLL